MRFNLFANSLILASISAIELASDDYNPFSMLAQVETGTEWAANGFEPSSYKRPEDNCCQVYLGKDFTDPVAEPLCWKQSTDKPGGKAHGAFKTYGSKEKTIQGIDCGKSTWAQVLDKDHEDKFLK